jgi:hypothetical protein
MTTQRDLYDAMLARTVARQGELFTGTAVDVPCDACGTLQVVTEGGYLTCPRGCLKLRSDFEVRPDRDPTEPDLFS